MKLCRLGAVAIMGAVLFSAGAFAAEFEIARVKVNLPGDGWTQLDAANKQLSYGGDFHGELGTARKTFLKSSAAKAVQAVVVVESSSSSVDTSRGSMSYSPKCEGTKDFYADGNSGFHRSFAKCLQVTKLFSASSMFGAFAPEAQQRLVADGVAIPASLRGFSARYANSFGIFLNVYVLVPPKFPGMGIGGDDAIPPGIGERNVRWGDALMEAVQGGVNSLSGAVALPALDF